MKQQLISITNSALLGILLVTVVVCELTKINAPKVQLLSDKNPQLALNNERQMRQALPISQIYGKRNIFGLDWDTNTTESKFDIISTPELSELKLPEPSPFAVKEAKENVIDPLNISLNGIISSNNENNNACIIADSSGQEKMYRVGDTVQDGIILDVTATSVALIRPNGQIETFKIANADFPDGIDPLAKIINKIDDTHITLDHLQLGKYLTSLGQLIEELNLMPNYDGQNFSGFLAAKVEDGSMGALLGFVTGDLITAINGSKLDSPENRIAVYDKVLSSGYGTTIPVALTRNNQSLTLEYKFEKQSLQNKSLSDFLQSTEKTDENAVKTDKPSKENKTAGRMNSIASFTRPAEDKKQYADNIASIRKRLLDNANRHRFSQPR